jgi:polyhydroxybutyrate depolymerase
MGLGTACRSACPGGCGGGTRVTPRPAVAPGSPAAEGPRFGGKRPAQVIAPGRAANGLLLALHGYGDTGTNFVHALDLPAAARRQGFVLIAPDGTVDPRGRRFWNATDACCDFFDEQVDDVAYLRALLTEVAAAYRVDPRRRYVLGLSNGAFMAHRLACEAASEIAAIVAIAGTLWDDPARCAPASPVSVLQVHGDADRVIFYRGGERVLGIGKGAYPGSVATVERWARLDSCAGRRGPVPPALDLDHEPGAETTFEQTAGCPAGIDVCLLGMRGAPHVPAFSPAFAEWALRWLEAHPKVTEPLDGGAARTASDSSG